MSREFLFFFSALGAFNGLLLSLYFLLLARPRSLSNTFLGLLLLTLSIRIGKSVIFYFNPDLGGIFLQFGMTACLFIGPSLFCYIKSVYNTKPPKGWYWHFVTLGIAIAIVNFRYPWDQFPKAWYYTYHVIYGIWLIYILGAIWQVKGTIRKVLSKEDKISGMEIWILSIVGGNTIIWLAYNLADYTSYITGALSFSFVLYLLVLFVFLRRRKDPSFLSGQVKYANKKIALPEARRLQSELNHLLQNEKLYKNADLKLSDLAARMKVPPHKLSQLLNDNLNKNFTLFVNEYRIAQAKELISTSPHLKLESIGYECGFNSKTTFYSSFKRIVGVTPATFKDQNSI